jgi:hypothetical protein
VVAEWVPPFSRGPVTLDVDDDGTEDVLGIFRQDTTRSYVVAIDGARSQGGAAVHGGGKALWMAGPFAGVRSPDEVSLTRVGATVAYADAASVIHLLEPKTGEGIGDFANEFAITEVCPLADGSPRAYVVTHSAEGGNLLDAAKRTYAAVTPRNDALSCHGKDDLPLCSTGAAVPCHPARPLAVGNLVQALESYEDAPSPARVPHMGVGVGWDASRALPAFAVGVSLVGGATEPALVWQTRVSLPADSGTERDLAYAFAKGRLVVVYQTRSGIYRLVARDVESGKVAWSTDLAGSGEGSRVHAIRGTLERVYLAIDDRLAVYRATDGAPALEFDHVSIGL